MKRSIARAVLIMAAILFTGCDALSSPTATPTPTDTPTATPTDLPTDTPAPTLTPSDTPTPTLTPTPSDTPTPTLTPTDTPPPTATFTPTNTPQPSVGFLYDNWSFIQAPANILTLLNQPMVAFINGNNRDTVGDIRTPQPTNTQQTLYYSTPSGNRVPILTTDATTGSNIFIAPTGNAIAYLRLDPNPNIAGLYLIDMTLATPVSGRVLPITSLVQRGIVSTPAWNPAGTRMAIALASGYDMDIWTVGRDGSSPTNLTGDSGAYEFFPSFSPDGRSILFVSDRAACPSWRPGDVDTCDGSGAAPPIGGGLYLIDIETRAVTQLSDQYVIEPPRWLNPRQVVFAVGDPLFDNQRELWIVDVITRQARPLVLMSGNDPIKLNEAWSGNGQLVFYQAANASSTELVLAAIDGSVIARTSEWVFARYGVSASWSPDGSLIAIGGVNGQCPYGVIVNNANFASVGRTNPPPSMCEPAYSPNGNYLAYTGVNPRIDGRVDIYVANPNGYGSVSLTGTLRGTIDMLGWVGGQ
ncbi:hypothetical protein FBR02_01180 [Anaerolineae bacterium CFX9]|nr:hypothetical protein [Anaerolineae bacterium CFX9]